MRNGWFASLAQRRCERRRCQRSSRDGRRNDRSGGRFAADGAQSAYATPRQSALSLADDASDDPAGSVGGNTLADAARPRTNVITPSAAAASLGQAQQARPAAYIRPRRCLRAAARSTCSRPPPSGPVVRIDHASLEQNARLLESVLDDFGVKGRIGDVRPGPVVTMYELEPAPGLKASRVIGLSDDIARSMSAVSARVAVVPGRNIIGIELPNPRREMVVLSELLASAAFDDQGPALPLVLGKNIAGDPVIADLSPMPHLLIAGTTGSGKSVGLNCMILSLLYRLTPDQCRMIMIDPKMLELSVYDRIPHLLSPVVTEPAKAIRALKWAVEQMEDRYRMMSTINVRSLSGFNQRVREAKGSGKPFVRKVHTGYDDAGVPEYEEEVLDYETLPLIVVVVDELADLMMTAGKEVEFLIQRLAQKGPRRRHPPDHGNAAPIGRRHHRRHQGEPADAHQLPGDQQDRQPHHPRRAGRRTAARQGRHALHARRQAGRPRPRARSSATRKSRRSPITGAPRAAPTTSTRSPKNRWTAASSASTPATAATRKPTATARRSASSRKARKPRLAISSGN